MQWSSRVPRLCRQRSRSSARSVSLPALRHYAHDCSRLASRSRRSANSTGWRRFLASRVAGVRPHVTRLVVAASPKPNRYCDQTVAVWCTSAFCRAMPRRYLHRCRPWHFVVMSQPRANALLAIQPYDNVRCRSLFWAGKPNDNVIGITLAQDFPREAGPPAQRKRTFNVARPKILRPSDFAPTRTTPVRVAGSSDLIRPLNSMSAPSSADTIAGCGQPHRVAGDRTGVARPCGGESGTQTHGEHSVGDHIGQPGQLGDALVPVDRVGVAGHPGVVHQVAAGQPGVVRRQLVADLHVVEGRRAGRAGQAPVGDPDLTVGAHGLVVLLVRRFRGCPCRASSRSARPS